MPAGYLKKLGQTSAVASLAAGFALCLGAGQALAAEPVEEVRVSGARLRPSVADASLSTRRIEGFELRSSTASRIDQSFRRVPGFGLFRRASSLVAHPTTQGVTLRNLGPNGAGRTLVLLDGVPINDPFGGWVYWSALNPETIEGATFIRGGGAGRWGNGALAGTLSLETRFEADEQISAQARAGSFGTTEARGAAFLSAPGIKGFLAAQAFDSDGFFLLDSSQRGAADVRAASEALSFQAGFEVEMGAARLLAKAGYFEESRINGLALARNATDGWSASLHLVKEDEPGEPSWQLGAYWQKRDFKNSFAAVDETRSTDRPVLDQFDVPGQGYGLNGLLRLPLGGKTSLEAGFDARFMSGATNELFRNLGAGFTRQRNAGGRERLAGLHAQIVHEPMDALSISASVRLDSWKTKNGRRLETDLADGSVVREDDIPSRKGTVLNGRLGAHYQFSEAWALRAAAYTGFRLPTINEFYRPFRVRNDITEANPALNPERLYGIDLGLERKFGGGIFSATFFRNWLRDGVGNVTIALGPGFFPPTGFVPDGGTLRQRQNIDRIAADGLEAELDVELSRRVSLSAGYLFSRVRVRRFQLGPELEGRRLAQSPKHQAVLSLAVTPAERLRLEASARWTAKAFDDDLNSRVLADALTLDAGAAFELAPGVTLFGAVENLFGARVESARSGDGLVTIAGPRRLSAGFRLGF